MTRKGPYTKKDILDMCEDALRNDPEHFYQKEFVNYAGKTKDTDELYSEVVSEFLLENIEEFKGKAREFKITREEPYWVESHKGKQQIAESNRKEEIVAKELYNQSQDGLMHSTMGRLIDFQTPLKNSADDSAGKIDLLAFDDDTNLLRVVEFKHFDNRTDSLLRTVLEAYTYLKTVDGKKLVEDFELPADTFMRATVLVCWDSRQCRELLQERPMQRALMRCLNIDSFFLRVFSDCPEGMQEVYFRANGYKPEYMLYRYGNLPGEAPMARTKEIVRSIKKNFPESSPEAARFCSSAPDLYNLCLEIIGDPAKLTAIYMTNELGYPPIKALAKYIGHHGTYAGEYFNVETNPNAGLETEGIEELLQFLFWKHLVAIDQEAGLPVDVHGIKEGARFVTWIPFDFVCE